MNKNRHRVVFNAARGLRMVVAECARSVGKASTTTARTACTTVTLNLTLVAQLVASLPAHAQIAADPSAPGSQRPTVLTAPNGVPLVNIQTPSAAGVSRNTYRQFDVGGQGAILNNSRTHVQTQLGGWVPGNPWLASGGARVILNEVNSTHPSYLNGFVEVAGQRAEVIIANPAGIQVNGGGFINASGVTLTTGTPVMNSGSLESFRVQRGQVQINGLGLDMRGADAATILARAIEVNAAIWANQLTLVGGAAQTQASGTDASGAPITTPIAADPNAPKPRFMLDVAAIGGMYAGHIFLVGSEDGLGVSNRGTIASQGQLTLLPNGQLINHGSAYGQHIRIDAPSVHNQDGGVIAARESLTIHAERIHNTEGAELLSLGQMVLNASERIENRSARIEAQGSLDITTPVLVNANDHFKTELVAQPGQRYLRLRHNGVDYRPEELGLNFAGLDHYDDQTHYAVLLPSSDYPFTEYPALAALWAEPYGGHPAMFMVQPSSTTEPCPGGDCNPTVRDTYAPEHPIWRHLGVSSPGAAPVYTGPACENDSIACSPAQWDAQRAWREQMNQYNGQKFAQQKLLDQKIDAYNDSVRARTLSDWTVVDASATDYNPRVLSSAPGQIVSGGDMTLNTSTQLLNHNSEVLAGGTLRTSGATLENRGSDVIARTELSGQIVHSRFHDDGDLRNDDRLYEFSPYQAVQERGEKVNVARSAGGQAIPAMAPSTALFQPASPQSGTLVETDPLFANHRQWLGSDYLLKAFNADQQHKRLGDGFYEQRLIREQVGQLTGQRFLGDYRDDEAQFLALMNAGLTFADEVQLRPGIALTADQMAALTSDIVWLVAEDVTLPDGRTEKALVPRVYLAPRAGDLAPSGALIAGSEVRIHMSGDVLNSGTIAGRQLVQIDAARDISHSGKITTQGTAALSAGRDMHVASGEIAAKDAIVLDAGRDLDIVTTTRSTTTRTTNGAGTSTYERTGIDRQAKLYVSGEAGVILAQAGRDITLTGADIRNEGAGPTAFVAGRDLNMDTVRTSASDDVHWNENHRQRTARSEETGTRIAAAGDVHLQAGQHLVARAVDIQAQGDIHAKAPGLLLIDAGERALQVDEHHHTENKDLFSSKSVTTDLRIDASEAQRSRLQGRNVVLDGGATFAVGADIEAREDIHIRGATVAQLHAAQDTYSRELEVHVRRKLGVNDGDVHQSKTEINELTLRSQAHGTSLKAGNSITLSAPDHIALQGARLEAPDIHFEGPGNEGDGTGQLLLGAVVNRDVHSSDRRNESDRVWQKVSSHGHESDTLVPTELHGKVHIDPALKISAQIPQGELRQQIEVLSQQPGMAYLGDLAKRDDIDWQSIELAQRSWDHEQQGLTGLGAAIVTIVVAYFTAGMGSGLVGTATTTAGVTTTTAAGVTLSTATAAGVSYTAAGAAINAGVATLASTAAVSFVNNGGDIGAVLKDLGSSDSVKAILTTMVTAGITQGISNNVSFNGKTLAEIGLKDGTGAYLGKQLIEQTSRAMANAALLGTDLEDAIVGALVSSALTTLTAYGAKTIGTLTVPGENGVAVLTPAGQKLAHALLGCASGAVQTGSEGCAAGATGAVLGELAAEWFNPDGKGASADTIAFAQLIAGLGGALVAMHTDGDAQSVGIAATAGANAAANNYLRHVEAQQLADLKFQQLQGKCDQACAADIQRLEVLDQERNKALAACEGSNTAQCQSVRQELRVAAAEYIRAIDPSLDLRTLQERDETLRLAHNSMGGVSAGDVVGGYADSIREGVDALIGGAKTAAQALMGDPQALAALREGAGQLWSTVQDPEQWPYLLGAMTPQQREALALAYEQGDIRTIGRLMGEQSANLPASGGMGSIKKVGTLPSLPKGKSPVDIAHTIGADYNVRTGKVTGGHTLLNGNVRVTQVVSPPDANGVYEAFVELQLPDGTWQTKTVGSTGVPQRNTMFPTSWDATKVEAQIESAWNAPDRIIVGTKWSGTSTSGVRIEGYTTPRMTAFPVRQ